MILVILGTQDKEFKRLLRAIDKQIEKGNIKDKVVVQAGFTKYKSDSMEIFSTIPSDEFESMIEKASLIITHGGVGSILTSLKHNKKVIAAPRLAKYKEHTNDHQKQIVDAFSEEGYILALKDFSKLDKVLLKSKNFKPKKYISNKDNFNQNIAKYIEDVNHISWFNRDKLVILTAIINLIAFAILNSINLNIYISFTLSFILSCILLKVFKNKKLHNPFTAVTCFYLIEGLFLTLFVELFNFVIDKLIINIIIVIIYHFYSKRN